MRLKDVVPVLMCGGDGKRLYPLSRSKCPKPFIRLGFQKTLFQKTLERVSGFATPLVLTRTDLKPLAQKQSNRFLRYALEPCAKNTAPAILKMCLELDNQEKDRPHLFLPTDHKIADIAPLLNVLQKIECGQSIVLFGIKPTSPSTRYGYIGGYPLKFHEKPNKDMAQTYIKKGFLWNSGIILATPSTILKEAEKYIPVLLKMIKSGHYLDVSPISFDYAILEKSEIIKCAPVVLDWMDVGTWGAYLKYLTGK